MENKPGTYSKLYVQLIFAVQNRQTLLLSSWEDRLFRYVTGIIQQKDQLLIAINGHRDHIHILIAIKPTCLISDLVREIKKASTEFIQVNHFVNGKFTWQKGFGAFSYSRWDVPMLISYIQNQKEHHRVKSFREEYMGLLKEFEVDYKPEHLFVWLDDAA